MENRVAVGNEYRRTLGAVKQIVTISGYDNDVHKWQYTTKSGKLGTADDKAIAKWELLEEAVEETAVEEKAVVNVERKKNACTCLEAAIQTLVKRNVPMTAKQLVKAMIEDEAFFFSPTAKTPWNSVGTRLSTYMNNCDGDCRIKQIKRGLFAHADYEEAVTA